MDTDVEIIKPLDKILEKGPYMGCEPNTNKLLPINNCINTGLGMAAYPHMSIYKEILNLYENQHFVDFKGKINQETVVTKVTKLFLDKGFKGNNKIEHIEGISVYSPEYFCPKNYVRKLQ